MRHASKVFGILMISVLALTGCRGDGVVAVDDQSARDASAVQAPANTVPFRAKIRFTSENVPPPPPPIVNTVILGAGKAKPFGPFEFSSNSQINVTVFPFDQTIEMVFTFRNGDELYAAGTGSLTPVPPPGNAVFSGDMSFQGGTGRFANASGTVTYSGTTMETAPRFGVGELTIEGDISGFGGAGN